MIFAMLLAAALASAPPAAAPATPVSTPADLQRLHGFAQCMVKARRGPILRMLRLDYDTPQYSEEMRSRAKENGECLGEGKLQFGGVLLAGAMAEDLLETAKVDVAAVSAIDAPPVRSRSDTETMALCTVKAQPAGTSALLATRPGSPDELAAIRTLSPALGDCLVAGAQANFNAAAVRAVLSLAALHLADRPIPGAVR